MKRKLINVFDLQKFHNNECLAALISETNTLYNKEISDDDLEHVNAAGDINHKSHKFFSMKENTDE